MVCDTKAYCWGAGGGGRLGIGSSPSAVLEPMPVAGGFDFVDLAVGNVGGCGLGVDGEVRCWGSTEYGALGVGQNFADLPQRTAPDEPVAFEDLR